MVHVWSLGRSTGFIRADRVCGHSVTPTSKTVQYPDPDEPKINPDDLIRIKAGMLLLSQSASERVNP